MAVCAPGRIFLDRTTVPLNPPAACLPVLLNIEQRSFEVDVRPLGVEDLS